LIIFSFYFIVGRHVRRRDEQGANKGNVVCSNNGGNDSWQMAANVNSISPLFVVKLTVYFTRSPTGWWYIMHTGLWTMPFLHCMWIRFIFFCLG